MIFPRLTMAAAFAALLAAPAGAQTMQLNPTTPGDPSISPHPNLSTVPHRSPTRAATPVDINSASPETLDALPGVGRARAEAIVKNRPYRGKDELTGRHIIPQKVYDQIKNRIVARQ